jgi:hypothetical protein
MRRTLKVVSLFAISFIACADQLSHDTDTRVVASRAVTQEFMQSLKGALQQAMKDGGPVSAIAVCNQKAPAIAATMSAQKGWRVARTSLKIRNPENVPDSWERATLEVFELRLQQGEDPQTMEYYEVIKQEGMPVFRYMKAIPTGEVCLACHGAQIDAGVAAKLKELYPTDQATGYKAGNIRGAFTITQPM